MSLFFDGGAQDIGRYGAPNLRLHRVLASSQTSLEIQVRVDSVEEQFNLPEAFVEFSNIRGRQRYVVGQKHQRLARCRVFGFYPAHLFRVVSFDLKAVQRDVLIADYAVASVCCTRLHTAGVLAELDAVNRKSATLVRSEQPNKIQIAPVYDVEGARFEWQDAEYVHIAEFAVADMDERGDRPSQIQQRVHHHSRPSRAKWHPIEQTQTPVDGGEVQRVDGCTEINANGFFDVVFRGIGSQVRGQNVINAPIPQIQGIGQSRVRG